MATERILIVDDEEPLCEVLQLNLENYGYAYTSRYNDGRAKRY